MHSFFLNMLAHPQATDDSSLLLPTPGVYQIAGAAYSGKTTLARAFARTISRRHAFVRIIVISDDEDPTQTWKRNEFPFLSLQIYSPDDDLPAGVGTIGVAFQRDVTWVVVVDHVSPQKQNFLWKQHLIRNGH